MRLAVLPRHVTAAVALAVAASCSSPTAPSSRASSTTQTVARLGAGASRRQPPAPIRRTTHVLSNGVDITFSTTTDAHLLEPFRLRLQQANVDATRFGQPTSPTYCMPQQTFFIGFDFGTERYQGDGTAPIGSGVPIRVLEYGEDQHSVYVVARAYDAAISSMRVTLTHPQLAGAMTPLGDRWYVFAAAVGTEAPWYTQGVITGLRSGRTNAMMSVPEGTDRLTRC